MSFVTKTFCLCLLSLTLGFAGCDSGSTDTTAAPSGNELQDFLADNPEIANAEYSDELEESE